MTTSAFQVAAALSRRTWSKALRRPVVLSFSLVQPMLWMLLFGFLFERYRIEGLDNIRYLDFLIPGICAMTVLFGASQSGIELIRDMQTHFLGRLLSTPANRNALLFGKLAADVSRLLVQATVVFFLGLLIGGRVSPSPSGLVLAVISLGLFGFAFASLSCIIALVTRAPEGMAVFVHVVNMPLLFTSSAFVPSRQMPRLLASVSQFNPLTLTVGALRGALLFGQTPPFVSSVVPLAALALVAFSAAAAALKRTTLD